MEAKKTFRADVERSKYLYASIGLIISLALVILAFEWKFYDRGMFTLTLDDGSNDFEEILEIPPTTQPAPQPPVLRAPVIIVVPDEELIVEEIEVNLDIEITEETEIEEVIYSEYEAPEVVEEEADEVFVLVEDKPEPKEGLTAFYKAIAEEINYPSRAKRMGIEGKVFVEFIVDKDGELTNIKVVRGIGAGCDEEAIRVISQMPNWKPGKQRGVPVKVRMIIPIHFVLEKSNQ